ncbi:3581_t:CDS:2, partial [Racocetra fulgida]
KSQKRKLNVYGKENFKPESPTITLICLVKGDPPMNAFSIDIDKNITVHKLKKATKSEKAPEFDNIAPDRLELWRVNIRDDSNELANIDLHNYDQLRATKKIKTYFEVLSEDHIHLIVSPPVFTSASVQEVLSIKPPSVSARHSEFFQSIQNPPVILNHRPSGCTGPPVIFYNEIFNKFVADFKNENLPIPPNILEMVDIFVKDMENGYSTEEGRCEILEKHLKNVIGPMEKVENSDKTKSDRVVTILAQSSITFALVVLAEVKNEIGTGSCDPTIQDPLTDFIPLMQFYNNSYYKRIARLLEALHLASIRLKTFYEELNMSDPCDQRFYPFLHQYSDDFGNNIPFNYNDLFMEDCTEFVWRATTEDKSSIIIKYTQTYNVNAHKICAEKQLAPRILFASNKVIDGWWVIIMESVEELSLYHAQLTNENYMTVMQDIKQAIKLLHDNELVFANLCSTNILVYKVEMNTRAMLFGFDWCGEHAIGRYPFLISSTVKWHHGVKAYALLDKTHDLFWLDALQERN